MSDHADTIRCDCKDCLHSEITRLEAEIQRLHDALEEILRVYVAQGQPAAIEMQKVARRALAAVRVEDAPRCSGYCVGTTKAETLVEDLACPVHGIEAQKQAERDYPDRQAWLDSLAAVRVEDE